MQQDLETNYPQLDIQLFGVNAAGEEAGNEWFTSDADLPWLQDVDTNADAASDSWAEWGVNYRDVVVLDRNNVPLGAFSLTTYGLHNAQNYLALRQIFIDVAMAADLPGDYNGNGVVEQADLSLVLLNWGSPASPLPSGWIDSHPMGLIDQEELNGVLLNWGNMAASLPAAAVPEPGTAVLIAVAGLLAVLGIQGRSCSKGSCRRPQNHHSANS